MVIWYYQLQESKETKKRICHIVILTVVLFDGDMCDKDAGDKTKSLMEKLEKNENVELKELYILGAGGLIVLRSCMSGDDKL